MRFLLNFAFLLSASSNGFAGVIGFLIIPPIMQTFGRKTVIVAINAFLLIGWLTFVFANNVEALFVARVTQGVTVGGFLVTSMIVSEYASPARRGYFLVLKKLSLSAGVLICHLTSIFWNWRQISGLAGFINLLCIVLTFFWVESPSHLAMKGRFDESEKSFVWLHGNDLQVKKELTMLISTQMERINKIPEKNSVTMFLKQFLKRDFRKPFFIAMVLSLVIESSGRHYFSTYSIQILIKIIGDKSIALYLTLGVDCLTILALFISCFVIQRFKRRTLLFTFGSVGSLLLFIISLIILYNGSLWITSFLVLFFSVVSNIGVVPISFSMFGEIFPLEKKGTGAAVTGMMMSLLYAITLRVIPTSIKKLGLECTFSIFGFGILICLLILYFILPETKDKTLPQIESEIKGVKNSSVEMKPMLSVSLP